MSNFKSLIIICLLSFCTALFASSTDTNNWPQWRGPLANGIVKNGNPPIKWDEKTNIKWKASIPGLGLATPVVWGNQIFIQTAIESKEQSSKVEKPATNEQSGRRRMRGLKADKILEFTVYSIDRKTGKILWKKVLNKVKPHEGTHNDASWASCSPVTDGKHVYAYFGSFGLYCLNMKGKLKWKKDFGDMYIRNAFGEGSSPAIYQNRLFILWDHEKDSFIVCLDKTTGKEIWKKNRDERTSWSTPLVFEHKNNLQVLVNGTTRIRSYDFKTGEIIWEAEGMTVNVIPSPVFMGDTIYFTSGFRGSALLAVNLNGAKGNITGTKNIVWTYNKNTPYTPSPLLYKGILYFLKVNTGTLTTLSAKTGEVIIGSKQDNNGQSISKPQKLDQIRGVYASPIGVQNRVYIVGRNGVTYVLKAGKKFEVLSINKLDEGIDASPVVIGNDLYLRGRKSLYCISKI